MKTPEQVADEAIAADASDHLNMEIANAEDVHAIVTRAIEADRAQRHHWDAEIYIVQNDMGDVVGAFRDADEATAAYQDGYVWVPGEYAEQRIQHLTSKWEESVNYGRDESEEPYRASDYAISEDDWRAGLDDEEAAEIVCLIEWQEAQK